ncbi:hypothetical protein SAMN04488074_11475 [Lentzea albidocapillata subsp. violacea]|uniref:Uncharacterized protein n=1 Tax=Lentzea albidocapillata subsp. violacea TaxID=128104 RepID=A0A1G9NM96_9PSEU|nr:hypothetical protein SAMN04488074_11475 [Lentzea albidocapillata subsp. violacea]
MRAFVGYPLFPVHSVRFAGRVPTEKERLDVVEPQVATLISHVGQVTAELERVTARLTVLERRLSGAGDGPPADLDAVTGEIEPLVEALRRGWDAEQEILADPARVALRQEVLEFDGLKARRDDARSKLDGGRVPRFERDALSHEVRQMEWLINANEAGAQRAAQRLEADEDAVGEEWRTEAVLAGDKARGEIKDAAARRISAALSQYARMPVWFRVGLGEIPTPDPSFWLESAIAVLAYRLEYGVTDAVTPLGTPPSAASGSQNWVRRANVHTDITDRLTTLAATFHLQ